MLYNCNRPSQSSCPVFPNSNGPVLNWFFSTSVQNAVSGLANFQFKQIEPNILEMFEAFQYTDLLCPLVITSMALSINLFHDASHRKKLPDCDRHMSLAVLAARSHFQLQ